MDDNDDDAAGSGNYNHTTATTTAATATVTPQKNKMMTPSYEDLFPYLTPYPQQRALMETITRGIPPPPPAPPHRSTTATTTPACSSNINNNNNNNNNTTTPTKTRILALESPTGTGKSLSLACASLAWLVREEQERQERRQHQRQRIQHIDDDDDDDDDNKASSKTTITKTGIDWLDDWQPSSNGQYGDNEEDDNDITGRHGTKPAAKASDRHEQLLQKLNELRLQTTTTATKGGEEDSDGRLLQRRENILRQALTKTAMEERQRNNNNRNKKKKKRKRNGLLAYQEENDHHDDENMTKDPSSRHPTTQAMPGTAEWLLQTSQPRKDDEHLSEVDDRYTSSRSSSTSSIISSDDDDPPPQIIYAARTHSQLSQFVREIQKIRPRLQPQECGGDDGNGNGNDGSGSDDIGRSLRVVALASRSQGLCGYLGTMTKRGNINNTSNGGQQQQQQQQQTPSRPLSDSQWTETCLELRKTASTTATGKCACPYFKSDEAVATLALHSLAVPTDVEDMAALGRSSKTCAYYATRRALPQAQLVTVPYSLLCGGQTTRNALGLTLHRNTLVVVDEAHNLPSAIANLQSATLTLRQVQAAQSQLQLYLERYLQRLNGQSLQQLGLLKRLLKGIEASMTRQSTTGGGLKGGGENSQNKIRQQQQQPKKQNDRYLLTSSEYLVSQKLDTINVFPVLNYMREHRLSQKLLGFMPKKTGNKSKDGNDIKNGNGDQSSAATSTSTPTHISPMSIVETFLGKFTYASNHDGQVVVDTATPGKEHVQFVVLNPAVLAQDDLWTKPRAVCLVGGTLRPLSVMMQELVPSLTSHARRAEQTFAESMSSNPTPSAMAAKKSRATGMFNPYARGGCSQQQQSNSQPPPPPSTKTRHAHQLYTSDPFWAFTCGHVVESSRVLLQALTKVDGTTIDVRFQMRSTPAVCGAIGKAILQLCKTVPHGVVVFLPSYKYEQVLVESWKSSGIWNELARHQEVVREPKEASQVDAVLSRYSEAATKSQKGALLLSVVGGKLSEGINFANDLCRCVVVVGLPFADRSDPLLQEKLKLVENEREYYQSMCLRAVNQSVGRAIRHAKDYASIVLMDARYPRDDGIANGLPQWLTDSTPQWRIQLSDLSTVLSNMETFFEQTKK